MCLHSFIHYSNCRASFEDNNLARIAEYVDDPAGLARHHAKKDIARREKEFQDVIKQRKNWFGPKWGAKTFKKSSHPLSVIVSDCLKTGT